MKKTLGQINAEATANLSEDCFPYSELEYELMLRDTDWSAMDSTARGRREEHG